MYIELKLKDVVKYRKYIFHEPFKIFDPETVLKLSSFPETVQKYDPNPKTAAVLKTVIRANNYSKTRNRP